MKDRILEVELLLWVPLNRNIIGEIYLVKKD